MELLLNMINAKNWRELQKYILENHIEILDFLSQTNHSALAKYRNEIRRLSLKKSYFLEFDYSISENITVVNSIISASIRLGDNFLFGEFYRLFEEKGLNISKVVKASALYLFNKDSFETIWGVIEQVHDLLEEAYKEEEDNNKNVIASLLYYYQFIVKNFLEFTPCNVSKVYSKIKELRQNPKYLFNKNNIIDEVLRVELSYESNPVGKIYKLIDDFLGRKDFIDTSKCNFLIESGTQYCFALGNPPYDIDEILTFNKKIYSQRKDDDVYFSLQRGVSVIKTEIQLLCYMFAYGAMHVAKLEEALSNVPEINDKHRVIDWGCGQGIGSLCYLQKVKRTNNSDCCREVFLIEPSLIALKRASLHLKNRIKKIITCNKEIDSVSNDDIKSSCNKTVHIFSNILDVELFSLNHLIELIKNNCIGLNIFIITSPYINDSKTARIDTFQNCFKSYPYFKMLYNVNARCNEWKNGWSKVIRVFQVYID